MANTRCRCHPDMTPLPWFLSDVGFGYYELTGTGGNIICGPSDDATPLPNKDTAEMIIEAVKEHVYQNPSEVCEAEYHYGRGHQATDKCVLPKDHETPNCVGWFRRWKTGNKSSGFFDEDEIEDY